MVVVIIMNVVVVAVVVKAVYGGGGDDRGSVNSRINGDRYEVFQSGVAAN